MKRPDAHGPSHLARKWTLWIVLCGLLAGGSSLPVRAETAVSGSIPDSRELALFDGRWEKISDEQAEALRLLSIQNAVEDMSWIMRRVASSVLKKSTAPPPQMEFDWDGEGLYQLVADRDGDGVERRTVRLNADSEKLIDPRGEAFFSNWIWTDDGLQVNWRQDQAYGSNIYRVEPDSERLHVEHRIHITAISGIEPIVYQSAFERNGLPSVASAAELSK